MEVNFPPPTTHKRSDLDRHQIDMPSPASFSRFEIFEFSVRVSDSGAKLLRQISKFTFSAIFAFISPSAMLKV